MKEGNKEGIKDQKTWNIENKSQNSKFKSYFIHNYIKYKWSDHSNQNAEIRRWVKSIRKLPTNLPFTKGTF